jgi:hypothetical protein
MITDPLATLATNRERRERRRHMRGNACRSVSRFCAAKEALGLPAGASRSPVWKPPTEGRSPLTPLKLLAMLQSYNASPVSGGSPCSRSTERPGFGRCVTSGAFGLTRESRPGAGGTACCRRAPCSAGAAGAAPAFGFRGITVRFKLPADHRMSFAGTAGRCASAPRSTPRPSAAARAGPRANGAAAWTAPSRRLGTAREPRRGHGGTRACAASSPLSSSAAHSRRAATPTACRAAA